MSPLEEEIKAENDDNKKKKYVPEEIQRIDKLKHLQQ